MSLFQPLWQPAETSAASIPNLPAGSIAATTVQAALNELDVEKLAIADIDDAPVDGVVNAPISSNWAYDHLAVTHSDVSYVTAVFLGALI